MSGGPHELWRQWGASPLELTLIFAPAVWYALGVRALWRRAGTGHGVTRMHCAAFACGVVALFVALASPLDAAGEAIFSAHMLQHLVLILVAAPLMVLGAPEIPMLWALSPQTRRRVATWWHRRTSIREAVYVLTAPGVVFVAHMVALWFWHFPAPYQAALRHPALHALEHLSFFGTALLFWWTVMRPVGRPRASDGVGIFMIAGTLAQSGVLGAMLMFARTPWYPMHAAGAQAWGLTLLEDQQLAGLMMWVPATFVYIAAAAWVFVRWMRADERHAAALPVMPVREFPLLEEVS